MNKLNLLATSFLIITINLLSFGQDDWGKILKENITPKLFTEVYYSTNALDIEVNERPDYFYNYKKLNELGLNSAIIGFDFDYRRVRSSISFIGGNYATYNIQEPDGLKHLFEANAGYKLLKHHDLWLDAGIMESNLGFESVVSSSNPTMTRSLLAESSPYYLNAVKLSYTTYDEDWLFEVLLSNGWQKMTDGRPSLGHTIQFYPNDQWTVNSSSFIGGVKEPKGNSFKLYNRFFHNFYVQYEGEKAQFVVGVDYGFDRDKPTNPTQDWEAYIVQFTYCFTDKISSTIRGTYFRNIGRAQLNNYLPSSTSSSIWSSSLNIGIQLHELIKLKLEASYSRNQITYGFFPGPPNYQYGPEESLFLGTSVSIDLWND